MFRAIWQRLFGAEATEDDSARPLEPGIMSPRIDFDGDRPIDNPDADELGFGIIAERLATSVRSSGAKDGLVIGIEGQWGSGKSSILNLLCIRLTGPNVSVVKFDPWIVSDRDSMVAALIGDIAKAVDSLSPRSKKAAKKTAELATMMRAYGAATSRRLVSAVNLAGLAGVPFMEAIGKALEEGGKLLEKDKKPTSIIQLKAELVRRLRSLQHRFVVVVDDLDRLEPKEAAEVTRLIRAVGDFPNVIYLLCYDRDVLAHSLKRSLKVRDGRAFLQKIVQVTFAVPIPQEFDLRRLFHKQCIELCKDIAGQPLSLDTSERLVAVVDREGGLLETPRDVTQVMNAIRLFYPPIARDVDFPDLVWLQVVRLKNEGLYRWAERYLGTFAALHNMGARLRDDEKESIKQQLEKLAPSEDAFSPNSIYRLGELIPGISNDKVFDKVDADELTALESGKRLGSPQYYRRYFSFSDPSGTLGDDVWRSLISKAEGGESVTSIMSSLISQARPQGGTMYEVALDRISRMNHSELSVPTLTSLTADILDTVDVAQKAEPEPGWFEQRKVWRTARKLFGIVLGKLTGSKRASFLEQTFSNRKAIGFLMAELGSRLIKSTKRLLRRGGWMQGSFAPAYRSGWQCAGSL